jgi:hypothetical protein
MDSNSHDRDLRRARVAYVAAVRQVETAMNRFGASDVPLDPGPGPDPRPWSAEHIQATRDLAAALAALLDRRRAWEALRREWRAPH